MHKEVISIKQYFSLLVLDVWPLRVALLCEHVEVRNTAALYHLGTFFVQCANKHG